MATVTEKLHNGNTDAATTYSFPFQYIKLTDVKVEVLEGTPLAWESKIKDTDYEFPTATTVKFKDTKTPPAGTDNVRIYRETDSAKLTGSFYPNAAIRSQDLNENFNQNLFLSQETENDSDSALSNSRELNTTTGAWDTAIGVAKAAKTVAEAADEIADGAKVNADKAIDATDTLVATKSGSTWTLQGDGTTGQDGADPKGVKYAVRIADAASSTAGDADTNATTALNNSRESDGSGGYTSAISIANTAKTTADTALDNSRESDGSGGYNTAIAIAKSAQDTVAESAAYIVVVNHAELPALSSLSEDKFYQVSDSTGIEDETDVSGVLSGFKGDDELAVKLKSNITADPKRWDWQEYYATDPEIRYRKKLIVENLRTISENYTIGSDNNAFSIGPVTISSGATIEIPENSKYVVMN